MSLRASVIGDVLTVEMGDESVKVKLPRGERGPAGRDGMSIRGDVGPMGPPGHDGLPGRDSVVPGPKGDRGENGTIGKTPVLSIGKVEAGDNAAAYLHGTPEAPVLDLILPRGLPGATGRPGLPGRHGSHEFVEYLSLGHSPRFSDEMWNKFVVCDGIIDLPVDLAEEHVGRWVHVKSFDRVVVNGCIEGQVGVEKGQSGKFVVIPYQDKFLFTRF